MPVRDIPVVAAPSLDTSAGREALDRACVEWGFFQLVDHGVPPALVGEALAQMRAFFALPVEAKRSIERTRENPWGFYDRELTKNVRDWKEVFDFGPAHGAEVTPWPDAMPAFRETMTRVYEACAEVARRLVAAIARNLGASPDDLLRCFDDHTSYLRLNYYPRCHDPAPPDAPTRPERGALAVHHHTDAGALTVLLHDGRPALQVERGGVWHTIAPRDDAFVINLGDVVQVWSNDRYRAPLHRVLASRDGERYSAPFFLNPSYATRFAPLASACAGAPARYRAIGWRAYRAGRAAGDYADVGEEIQIAHFRVEANALP